MQDIFALASKAYHVEYSLSGRQRFSWLAAERPQFPHTNVGSLTKILISFDFESGGNSQTLLVNFCSECFLSDILHLTFSY
jgi:hypothetical protein